MFKLGTGFAVAAWLFCQGGSLAASGTALGVDPAAQAERLGATQTLVVGADIFIGDRVVTGPSGQVQILFADRTELVVGPRSALLIEDYLLREDGSAGRLAIDALSGSFRFVTGTAPKNRYRITTPTGTIGVRGTAFDFTIEGGVTSVLLYHGAVELCTRGGKCVLLQEACDLAQSSPSDAVLIGHPDAVSGTRRGTLRSLFRYSVSQRPLLSEFRIAAAERCLNRPAGGGGPGSLVDGPRGPRTPPSRNTDNDQQNDDTQTPPGNFDR